MPQLTYPITPAGYIVPIMVGVDQQAMVRLHAAGSAIPSPFNGTGEIDSASNVTAISADIVSKLQLKLHSRNATQTAAGSIVVNLYEVSLSILPPPGSSAPLFTIPSMLVQELQQKLPVDVLVGSDVLNLISTLIDGPGGKFTLFT